VYLRHTTRRKDGKSHVYWRLVRSVRRGGKVVQETVAQLGENSMRRVERGPKSWRAVFVGVDRSATRGYCSIGLGPGKRWR
jgi:hypothetical protein